MDVQGTRDVGGVDGESWDIQLTYRGSIMFLKMVDVVVKPW